MTVRALPLVELSLQVQEAGREALQVEDKVRGHQHQAYWHLDYRPVLPFYNLDELLVLVL